MASSLDLTRLLPPQYRDKTLDTLIRNLFNRHLSKTDVTPLFGHVGSNVVLEPGDVLIQERDLERQINQLAPILYTEHGSEKLLSSWPDLIQKMVLMGVDYKKLDEWFKSKSYNFVPPVDLDKFCNYNQYFWIGEWITSAPSLPYYELGIPNPSASTAVFAISNPTYYPEYFVIERGELDGSHNPVAPQPTSSGWSDWALANLWVHKDDLIDFLNIHTGSVNFNQLVQATRPIIEYSNKIRLSEFQTALGVPADTGTFVKQSKKRRAQLPLFDLYHANGDHTSMASAIFYYQEGTQYSIDPVILRRAAVDSNNDFTFEHSLLSGKELLFFKYYNDTSYDLKTIWRQGPEVGVKYSKYDTTGTLINQDKFTNFKNYFWTGVDAPSQPSYNSTGLPEYVVVEAGGVTDWSKYNYWVHVSQLKRADLPKYVQASRPIIEFNVSLESEILFPKSDIYELPKFRLYSFNDVTDTYEVIPSVSQPNLNDAYVQSHLFARVADLEATKAAIVTTPEILANCFQYNDEYYIQGLYNGQFVPERNGTVYGYLVRQADFVGAGNGLMTTPSTATVCTPEVLTLTAVSATSFTVSGSVSGSHPNLTVGTPYTASGATFVIAAGATPFAVGDKFTIEIKSYVYEKAQLFIQVNNVYRTLTSPSTILTEKQSSVIVDADPTSLDGIWQVPPQIEWNVQNETRTAIGQGDLYFHLISIIAAQPGLIGGATGDNNWRTLNPDLGLGGTIKQYDGNTALLLSVLLQNGITPATLLDFARQSYEQLFSAMHTFVNEQIPTMLSNVEFTPPQAGDAIDPVVVERFKEYFANISPVVSATATVVDDYISTPFYDTTAPLSNLVATLPYFGLLPKVQPKKQLDLELNIPVIVHHDGHLTKQPIVTSEVLKAVVTKKFERSPGQQTAGVISGVNYPALPYKGQFWFKTQTGTLWFYNVVSDTNERPGDAVAGTYTYDRSNNTLYQFNGTSWVTHLPVDDPWTEVKLDLIEANLMLAIEQELYNNCPPLTPAINSGDYQLDSNYTPFLQQEFERFGVTYGVTDVYGTTYDPSNAFTWNYSSITLPGASAQFAAWQEVYRDIYDTPRPDLEPWKSAGYPNEAAFLVAYDVYASNPPGTTTSFDPTAMWPAIAPFVHSRLVLLGRPNKLSVDPASGALLPPYSTHVEGLTATPPSSAPSRFQFGDLGPVETFWKKTLNYLYSQQKIYFRINPLNWVQDTWGVKYELIGEYLLNSYLKNKESTSDFMLQGDLLKDSPQLSWFNVTNVAAPGYDITYSVVCVSRKENIFKVVRDDQAVPAFGTLTFADAVVSVQISPGLRGLFWGDGVTFTVLADGTIENLQLVYLKNFRAEGFNQIYVQYSRSYGDDLAVSVNKSLFSKWVPKLGYRFGGFINTDSLKASTNDNTIVSSALSVYLKENKFYNSSWLNALRIQLVQRGSTTRELGYDVPVIGPGGTPGEDWVFRVDNFNPARPSISWYLADTSAGAPYQDFVALDGKRTLFAWKHYTSPQAVTSYNAPFLITGIQNVVNFIFGYSDLRAAEGWAFNDQDNPVIDDSTGRPVGYQLLVEQFIAQQFSGATAGSAFLFNPFSRKVWYKTPRGVVADLYEDLGMEQETVPTLLDAQQKHIEKKNVRVFRQDDITEIVFDQPAYTAHLLTSEYEHVALFDNYSVDTLLYDAFLGQKTGDIFLEGEKQTVFSGKIDFGGHFLLGDQMKRNIESSVQDILGLYSTSSNLPTPDEKSRARALLGFQNKGYFQDRGTPEQTEFRFWQGMIGNKGTNFSIDAYINSERFKNATLDEYWAYKLAEYGDAREVVKSELKAEPEDCSSELANYLFLEDDELELVDIYTTDGGFDVAPYSIIPFDSYSLYTDEQAIGMEFFDPRGCILIRPDDEARWFRYSDLRTLEYFTADVIAEWNFVPDSITKCYVVRDAHGRPVRADVFEIVDVNYVDGNDGFDMLPYDQNSFDNPVQQTFFEMGDYIPGSNPVAYATPKFKRLNSSTIQILDPVMLNRPFKVLAYGPAIAKYSPNVLFNYQTNTSAIDDIIWWDPARGSHHPEAYQQIDYEQAADPARYNVGMHVYKNEKVSKQKPWGEGEAGKIWWNTYNLDWQYYADTKIYPDMHERLARWGATADYSLITALEWIKSDKSPQEYEKIAENDGELAVKYTINRRRTWFQRVVAWKYSSNPATVGRKFSAYQPSALHLSLESDGYGKAILKEGNLADSKITTGCKIAGATYSSTFNKTDANLTGVFGMAQVTKDPSAIIGSSVNYTGGAEFVTSPTITLNLTVDDQIISFRSDVFGSYVLSNEVDNATGKHFIVLTHTTSQKNQKIEVHDVPITAGTLDEYKFDEMGFTIAYSVTFDRTTLTESGRIQTVAGLIGNVNHDIFLRSCVDVFSPITFNDGNTTYTTLDGAGDPTTRGWVVWTDPTTNPGAGPKPPFNKYEPVLGPWVEVGDFLSDLAENITLRTNAPWTGFEDEDYNPYLSSWSPWNKILDQIIDAIYCTSNPTQFFTNNFTLTGTELTNKEIRARTEVYINNVKLRKDRWVLDTSGTWPVIRVNPDYLDRGDRVRAIIAKYIPTAQDLAFDPTVDDSDPLKLSQWAFDYPHVYEEKRNPLGGLTVKNYYFWVKNKVAPAVNKTLGVKQISTLLRTHDGSYAVPQGLKFYNQLDARPNRYALLSLKNLGRYVRVKDTYKLRLTRNPTLREDDRDITLKNVHVEWKLLRQFQPTRIPRNLWDLLTDTLCGSTALGQTLPFDPLQAYDDRNNTDVRYGFKQDQQILTDPAIAKATLKYTVLNTGVDKYLGGKYVTDYISYPGFDINNIDEYLSSTTNIRKFMSDLWRYAKPKQLNEIFFAVLQDAAASNLELTDFFKTSFISLNEVRTISTPGV